MSSDPKHPVPDCQNPSKYTIRVYVDGKWDRMYQEQHLHQAISYCNLLNSREFGIKSKRMLREIIKGDRSSPHYSIVYPGYMEGAVNMLLNDDSLYTVVNVGKK